MSMLMVRGLVKQESSEPRSLQLGSSPACYQMLCPLLRSSRASQGDGPPVQRERGAQVGLQVVETPQEALEYARRRIQR